MEQGDQISTKGAIMAGVNKAIILGRLGRAPELKTSQSGTAVCRFSLATTEKYNQA